MTMKTPVRLQKKIWQIPVLLLFFLCCIFLQPQQAAAKTSKKSTIHILFVGNSKTARNNLPDEFEQFAGAEGKRVQVDSVTLGGKTLNYLASHQATAKEMTQRKYDYVVLQEHTDAQTNYSKYLKGARKVTKLVQKKNPKVKMVVRKTWLRSNSSKKARQTAYTNTEKVAARIGAVVSEDGPAFDLCEKTWPNILLYVDIKHPTYAGTYLSVCCIYSAIFHESPMGCSYTAGLNPYRAKKLQRIAKEVSF